MKKIVNIIITGEAQMVQVYNSWKPYCRYCNEQDRHGLEPMSFAKYLEENGVEGIKIPK